MRILLVEDDPTLRWACAMIWCGTAMTSAS